jgi:hypothetical protein
MVYKPTLSSSIDFANSGKLDEWVHLFLCNEGNNKYFSDGLKHESHFFCTPEIMKLDKFERCVGPEKHMKFQEPEEKFYKNVENIALYYSKGDWDMPPLIIYREGNKYMIGDGNHRYEALKILGIEQYWIIICGKINNELF